MFLLQSPGGGSGMEALKDHCEWGTCKAATSGNCPFVSLCGGTWNVGRKEFQAREMAFLPCRWEHFGG